MELNANVNSEGMNEAQQEQISELIDSGRYDVNQLNAIADCIRDDMLTDSDVERIANLGLSGSEINVLGKAIHSFKSMDDSSITAYSISNYIYNYDYRACNDLNESLIMQIADLDAQDAVLMHSGKLLPHEDELKLFDMKVMQTQLNASLDFYKGLCEQYSIPFDRAGSEDRTDSGRYTVSAQSARPEKSSEAKYTDKADENIKTPYSLAADVLAKQKLIKQRESDKRDTKLKQKEKVSSKKSQIAL